MVNGHLESGTVGTEFSSWAGSLLASMNYIEASDPEARLAVIDARKFSKTAIYYVPNLSRVGADGKYYPHEYLLHGVIEAGMCDHFHPSFIRPSYPISMTNLKLRWRG